MISKLSNSTDSNNAILTQTLTHAPISKDAGLNKNQSTELENHSDHADAMVSIETPMMPDASLTEAATTTHGEPEPHTALLADTAKKTTHAEDLTTLVQ